MVAQIVGLICLPLLWLKFYLRPFCRFSVALVYYGISLSVQALSGDLYINNMLMGFVEVPGLFGAFLAVRYLSRPMSHGGLMILSGVFCLGAALLNEGKVNFLTKLFN